MGEANALAFGATDEATAEARHERESAPASGSGAARGLRFASPAERARDLEDAHARGDAVVVVAPRVRGRLLEAIEDACDSLLGSLGAPPPGMKAFGSEEDRVHDRIYRAHRLGKAGVTIAISTLRPIVGAQRGIAPEDVDALRLLAAVAEERPLTVLLTEGDTTLGAFRDPIPLAELFAESPEPQPQPQPQPWPSPAAAGGPVAPPAAAAVAPVDASSIDQPVTPDGYVFLPVEKPAAEAEARVITKTPTMPPKENPWRTHVAALASARGPQPLAEFERLFTEHYVPLTNAIEHGLDEPRARAAAEEFRHTFARSYSEAYATFAVTGKRPKMVLDVPEIAGRTARLHGARSVQLVLVDGMRWDLGVLVREALLVGLGPRATLAEESFLLAALPSTTPRQLASLARGLEGLRMPIADEGAGEGEALRGRTSEIVRRVRVGGRDLFKLDVVEARLRESDGHAVEQFGDIARRAASAIVRHAATLPPRTLLYVFGDHGFTIDGAGAAYQGGASPEEVLVPAFAFLLGMVQ